MPWVRIDENAMDHPKFLALSDGAWRLWCEGQAYCQKHLTDGLVLVSALRGFRYYSSSRVKSLTAVQVPGKSSCWHLDSDGNYRVHDFLDWNDSREEVLFSRECGKRRTLLLRDPDLRASIRERDGDHCRYCWREVRWHDRKGELGGTYDHVDPHQGNTFENLVVCCRGCNSSKKRRTPQEAGMVLKEPKSESRSYQGQIKSATSGVAWSEGERSQEREGGVGETSIPERAGAFAEWYADTHERLFGIGYMGTNLDYTKALALCEKFTDEQLRDGALVWFGMDDDFATQGTRTIPKFASRITGCLQAIKAKGIA